MALDTLLPPPTKGFSDVGILEDGDTDVSHFASIMHDCPYMMDLDGAKHKPDGVVEEQAVGAYTPIWDLIRVGSTEINRSQAGRSFRGLLDRLAITKKRNAAKEPTHVDMSGGKFFIPVDAQDDKFPLDTEETFLKLYALMYMQGVKLWLIEEKTPVFRLFMDLDFKQPEGLGAFKIEAITLIASRSIRKFWPELPDASFRVICCTTSYKWESCKGCTCACVRKTVVDPGCEQCKGTGCTGKSARTGKACDKCNGMFPVKKKTGVHLLFPELFVNKSMCLDMRETMIADFIAVFGQRSAPFNIWRDVVDETVYNASGLRMLGARKADPCPACKRKRKVDGEDCRTCSGKGSVDAGRPYAPLFVTDGSGRRDLARERAYQANYLSLLLDCKIRSNLTEPTAGWRVPEGAPTHDNVPAAERKGTAGGVRKTPTRHTRVGVESPHSEALQAWFRTCPQSAYHDLIVTSVLKSNKAVPSFLVNVTGPNCTFCQNVGRAHNSNRIFFVVTVEGVQQRCHDTADVQEADMKYGLCRDYASAHMPLSAKLSDMLFPSTGDAESVVSDSHSFLRSGKASEIKLMTLLRAGNRLCRELYNMDWSSSTRFASAFGDRLLQVQSTMMRHDREASRSTALFRTFHPGAIGSKQEDDVLSTLGFAVDTREDAHGSDRGHKKRGRSASIESSDAQRLRQTKTQVGDARNELASILQNIVSLCLHADNEADVVKTLREQGFSGLGPRARASKPRARMVAGDMDFDA